jgi:two-component sensor histidine kinase
MPKADKHTSLLLTEHLVLAIIWLFIFAAPAIFTDGNELLLWPKLKGTWIRLLPFLVLSLVNHFVLVPFILFQRRRWLYFIVGFMSIIVFIQVTNSLVANEKHRKPPSAYQPGPRQLREGQVQPPPRQQPRDKGPSAVPPEVNTFLLGILLVGFDTGLRTAFRWTWLEKEGEVMEKEKIKSELAFLRNQVSPHFFMNTLNNIHALIDFDAEEAKESIIRLSKLMRYLLYESEAEKIHLSREVEFISNYIDLMKLRYSDKVKIALEIDSSLPDSTIPPLLFTSFVENAFKHGISYQEESFVLVNIHVDDMRLVFTISNSNHKKQQDTTTSGIGIANSRKRLDLLYGNDYLLEMKESEQEYLVKLTLPL